MNKRHIDFTPKKKLPSALVKTPPEIIVLSHPRDDGRYLYVRDICRILGISRNSAYRLIEKLHAAMPDKGIDESPGQISKDYFMRQLYTSAAGKVDEHGTKGDG